MDVTRMPKFHHQGIKIFYEFKKQSDSAETIVFLNGIMASVTSWRYFANHFKKLGYNILLHEFQGQLLADQPVDALRLSTHVEDLVALMDYLGLHQAHLVGISYGGMVGIRFALDYSERVLSLTLINTASELDQQLRQEISRWKQLAMLQDGEAFFWQLAPVIFSQNYVQNKRHHLEQLAKAMKKLEPKFFTGQIALYDAILNEAVMTDLLSNIKVPTLIICGEADYLMGSKFSHLIHRQIKQSEFIMLPDCGHNAIYEKPLEIATLLEKFILLQYRIEK